MAEETQKEENVLTEEDKQNMQKDIEEARKAVISEDVDKKIKQAKDEARQEAERELTLKREAEEAKKRAEELSKQLEDSQKKSAEQFDALKKKVDEMSVSKAPARVEDPFGQPQTYSEGSHPVDQMSDADIDKLEERSARAFFGNDYYRMKNQ